MAAVAECLRIQPLLDTAGPSPPDSSETGSGSHITSAARSTRTRSLRVPRPPSHTETPSSSLFSKKTPRI